MIDNVSKIILIDDDNTTNYLHKRVLTKNSLCESIVVVKNGEEGIDALIEMNKDLSNRERVLIFLDLNMPVMDGWEFLEVLEGIKEQIKFQFLLFVVSSSINVDDIERAEKNSLVSKYLKKPLNNESITVLRSEYLNW